MAPPLTKRPLDLLYFIYLASHIAPALFVDLQAIMPPDLLPPFTRALPNFYVKMSGDPLFAGAMGLHGNPTQFTWFKTFMGMEAVFQVPMFLIGMSMLKKNSRYLPLLLVLYGAHVTTTVAPCLTTILATPVSTVESIAKSVPFQAVTPYQMKVLLASYIPFLVLPVMMTIDGTFRLIEVIQRVSKLEKTSKQS